MPVTQRHVIEDGTGVLTLGRQRSEAAIIVKSAMADEVSARNRACLKIFGRMTCQKSNAHPAREHRTSKKEGRCVGCSALFHCPVRAAWTVELNQ
jgi:hypothetical protein